MRQQPPDGADGAVVASPQPENQWACPRCTLFNPNGSNRCEVCHYDRRMQPRNQRHRRRREQHDQQGVLVEVREIDRRVVASAISIAGWSLFGVLVGGPVGALVGGGTAAAIAGAQLLFQGQQQQQQQQQRRRSVRGSFGRPLVTVTTTSHSNTPSGGSTMSVTTNDASGRRRTITIRGAGPEGRTMNPIDQQILQMMMIEAIRRGRATPEAASQMTFEELLQQFMLPAGDEAEDGDQRGRRGGATQETIDRCSSIERLGASAVQELKDNQTTCSICLEDFKEGDEMRKLHGCGHAFHDECINRWLSRVASCPICKKELEE